MIGCLYILKKKIAVNSENNISQMTTTTTLTGQYPFHEIINNRIASGCSMPSIASRIPSLRS